MLNRKGIKPSGRTPGSRHGGKGTKSPLARRRFVLSSAKRKATAAPEPNGKANGTNGKGNANGKGNGHAKVDTKAALPLPRIPAGVTINPTAHARTGGRNLQKERGPRNRDEAARLQPRFHGEGAHCDCREAAFRTTEGALRPRGD